MRAYMSRSSSQLRAGAGALGDLADEQIDAAAQLAVSAVAAIEQVG